MSMKTIVTTTTSWENTAPVKSHILILRIQILMKWFSASCVKIGITTRLFNYETKTLFKHVLNFEYWSFSIWARLRRRIPIIPRWFVMLVWRSIRFLTLIRQWLILPSRHRPRVNWRVKLSIKMKWTLKKRRFGRKDGEIDFADAKSVW